MKWLARMNVSAETARRKKIWDNYGWHKKIWKDCFPNEAQHKKRDFLTRIDPFEGFFQVWILARKIPQCPEWCPDTSFAVREIAPAFFAHQFYAFDLWANPVKTIVQRGPNGETLYRANGKRKSGKRVPLVKEEELMAWLRRKGKARCRDQDTGLDIPGGFKIYEDLPLEIGPMVANHFRRKGQPGYHAGVRFQGTLEVTDHDYFRKTYESGIGSAKGFGFGMLLLAPLNI